MPYCPTILLPVMTTVSVELPQGVPTLVSAHAPSRLLPPLPPLFRDARLGASVSGLLRRSGFEGSAARGVAREPDSDFSSFPMLPPALPDCARARPGKTTIASVADSRAAVVRCRMTFGKIHTISNEQGPDGRTHRADNAARFADVAARVKRWRMTPEPVVGPRLCADPSADPACRLDPGGYR